MPSLRRQAELDRESLLVAAKADSYTDLAEMLEVDRTELVRAANGFTSAMADRFAVKLGLHPSHIWPDWEQICDAETRKLNEADRKAKALQDAKKNRAAARNRAAQRRYRRKHRATVLERERQRSRKTWAEASPAYKHYKQHRAKEWRLANPERQAEIRRRYYENNRDREKALAKAHYEANRERIVAQRAAYLEAHRDEINARRRERRLLRASQRMPAPVGCWHSITAVRPDGVRRCSYCGKPVEQPKEPVK